MSAYVENVKSFIQKDIIKHLNVKDNNIDIKIPDCFTKHPLWKNSESKKKLIRCLVKGLCDINSDYIKIYKFYINDTKNILQITSKNQVFKKQSLEELMIDFVNYIIQNNQEKNNIPENLLQRRDKFFGFFIKIVSTINIDFKNNHKFIYNNENNELIVLSKERIQNTLDEFINLVIKDLIYIYENKELYKEFNEKSYNIPDIFCKDFSFKKQFLVLLSKKNDIIKNKFKFNFEEELLRIELNYCFKLFCKGIEDNCLRCHHYHKYGLYNDFFHTLKCFKIDNEGYFKRKIINNIEKVINKDLLEFDNENDKIKYENEKEKQLLEKDYDIEYIKLKESNAIIENINYFYYSLIYESYIDESLLKFENEEEELYYLKQNQLKNDGIEYDNEYLDNKLDSIRIWNIRNDDCYHDTLYQFDMSNPLFDYCFEICNEKLNIKKQDLIQEYKNNNKIFNEDYFHQDSLEKLIENYIDNPNVIFNLSYEKRYLKIEFNNWYKFLNKKLLKSKSEFPLLSPSSNESVKSNNSIWFTKNKKYESDNNYIKIDGHWIIKEKEEDDINLEVPIIIPNKNNKLRELLSPSTLSSYSNISPRTLIISPTPSVVVNMFKNDSINDEMNDYSDDYYDNYNSNFRSIKNDEDDYYDDYESDYIDDEY